MTPRTALVVGGSRGLGRAAAAAFVADGWRVFAAARTDDPPPGAVFVPLDVTDPASVTAALATIADAAPTGLDCLVCAAGTIDGGPLVEVSDERFERLWQVNVLGTVRVVRAAFPLVERARGRILVTTSELGRQHALPLVGPYAMTKHALEAYAESLRREVRPLGVRVVTLAPGPFRTAMTTASADGFNAVAHGSRWAPLLRLAALLSRGAGRRGSDPAVFGAAALRAATVRRPRHRYLVRPHFGRALVDRLPVPIVDAALATVLRVLTR